jgi:polyhydroxyalkanoate synthesis regulator protein
VRQNPFFELPLQVWQTSTRMWMSALDTQMSMMRAFLPQALQEQAEEVGDAARDMTEASGKGVDFAAQAAKSLAEGGKDGARSSVPV